LAAAVRSRTPDKAAILVVGEHADSLRMLTGLFTEEGYRVQPADSGQLALAFVATTLPDLILLDIRMSGTDGFEVCRQLKSDKRTKDIPVIFLSAGTEVEERVQGLSLGAVDIVSRPFGKEELLARVATHLGLNRVRTRLEQKVVERSAEWRAANERLGLEHAGRIRAEQAMRESEERFRSMADTAPVVIWTRGPDCRVDFCNRYTLELTGRNLEQLVGDGWKKSIHPEDLEQAFPPYIPILETLGKFSAEYRVRRADGEYRWLLDTETPRFLPNGDFAGYVGIAADITELKQSQEEQLASLKLESLGALVAGVAHDFGNFLGSVLAEAELALSDLPPESPALGSIERIRDIALRAAEVLAVMRDYSTGSDVSQSVNLSRIAEETVSLLKIMASKKVVFSLSMAEDLPHIRADSGHIRHAVLRVLKSAIETLPEGEGLISVATSRARMSPGSVPQDRADPSRSCELRLEISQSSAAVEDDCAPASGPSRPATTPGSDLGLSTVQSILSSYGGTMEVRGVPGRSLTFEIRLPCSEPVAGLSAPSTAVG
jgi:PAS domain S-box-containing protein